MLTFIIPEWRVARIEFPIQARGPRTAGPLRVWKVEKEQPCGWNDGLLESVECLVESSSRRVIESSHRGVAWMTF